MADNTLRYKTMILERTVYDNTKALIDFAQGSHEIDTALSDNASELKRILRCIDDVVSHQEYVLDSLIVKASCSPEGSYAHNSILASSRSESMRRYVRDHVPEEWKDKIRTAHIPENWTQLRTIVANDTLLTASAKEKILNHSEESVNPDDAEKRISLMPEYRYLREKIYPQLRSVSFDFHLHRAGMQKDTVHTAELDTLYMVGLKALNELDYKKAVEILRPYRDYNSALAFMSADYNHSALDILEGLDDTDAKVCYLKAMVLSRLGVSDEAIKYFELSLAYDPSLEYRANLDPEMAELIRIRNSNINDK